MSDEKNETPGDRQQIVDDAVKKFKSAGAVELAKSITDLLNAADPMRRVGNPNAPVIARLPIPFFREWVGPEEVVEIVAKPYLPCSPTHLLVSHATAEQFALEDIRIGNVSQTAAYGPIGLDLFDVTTADPTKAFAEITKWKIPPLMPGMEFALHARNRFKTHAHFSGVFWCEIR